MCGISGIALRMPIAGLDIRQRVRAMTVVMHHRGPDDDGVYVSSDGCVGLGNRRLAIRDLSPAGHMPMGNAAGTVWITYNGEIYNTQELRPELERLGYVFHSATDTEVILHGYEAWGEDVVTRLRGMWAFAILDRRPQAGAGRVFLSRDRLGIKPLYYAQKDGAFVWASELKALMAAGLMSREVDPAGLVGYLLLGSVPNPLTIFRGVHGLKPGCSLTLPLDHVGSLPEPTRYWSLPTDTLEPLSYVAAVEQIRVLLTEAVRIRLVSDVPLGAFLSGGLDSSAVVALMRQATTGPIRTCSMVFEEAEWSEAPYARAMAAAVGAEHYERVITAQDVADELPNILGAMDQPTVDGVNTYFVSQTARQAGLTVALSGLGGDELFGGYPNTFGGVPQMLRLLKLAQMVPGGASVARAAIGVLPNRQRGSRVQDALTRPATPASAYLTRRGLFSPSEVKRLVSPDVWHAALQHFDPATHIAVRADANGQSYSTAAGVFEWTSRAELQTYTHHQLLRDTDVMSMAHSLEVRVPLLDHKLVEAVLRLPAAIKQQGVGPKPLMKAALYDMLPALVRDRRDKRGFTFPFDKWLPQLRSTFAAAQPNAQELLNEQVVQRMWQLYGAGKVHWSRPWALSVFATWLASK